MAFAIGWFLEFLNLFQKPTDGAIGNNNANNDILILLFHFAHFMIKITLLKILSTTPT